MENLQNQIKTKRNLAEKVITENEILNNNLKAAKQNNELLKNKLVKQKEENKSTIKNLNELFKEMENLQNQIKTKRNLAEKVITENEILNNNLKAAKQNNELLENKLVKQNEELQSQNSQLKEENFRLCFLIKNQSKNGWFKSFCKWIVKKILNKEIFKEWTNDNISEHPQYKNEKIANLQSKSNGDEIENSQNLKICDSLVSFNNTVKSDANEHVFLNKSPIPSSMNRF